MSYAYAAAYATLKARGYPGLFLHRATTVALAKAARTGRTTSSVISAMVAR